MPDDVVVTHYVGVNVPKHCGWGFYYSPCPVDASFVKAENTEANLFAPFPPSVRIQCNRSTHHLMPLIISNDLAVKYLVEPVPSIWIT